MHLRTWYSSAGDLPVIYLVPHFCIKIPAVDLQHSDALVSLILASSGRVVSSLDGPGRQMHTDPNDLHRHDGEIGILGCISKVLVALLTNWNLEAGVV